MKYIRSCNDIFYKNRFSIFDVLIIAVFGPALLTMYGWWAWLAFSLFAGAVSAFLTDKLIIRQGGTHD